MRISPLINIISCGRILPIGFVALIFAAAAGGTSFAVGTGSNLQLVEPLVCPADSDLIYRLGDYEEIEEFPSASNPFGGSSAGRDFFVYCIQDGRITRTGDALLISSLLAILGIYYLICFLPLWIGSGFIIRLIKRKVPNQGS